MNRRITTVLLLVACAMLAPRVAEAQQGLITPFIGFTLNPSEGATFPFAEDEERRLTYGVALATLGNTFGFETDIAMTPDFFGKDEDLDNSVITVMFNAVVAP